MDSAVQEPCNEQVQAWIYYAAWLHNGGICDNAHDPEVPKACFTTLSDQDVPLDITGVSAHPDPTTTPFIAYRIDVTVYDTQ